MTETTNSLPHVKNWRFALILGVSIGVGMAIARGVSTALEQDLGQLLSFLISVVVSGLGGGLAALFTTWLLVKGSNKNQTT